MSLCLIIALLNGQVTSRRNLCIVEYITESIGGLATPKAGRGLYICEDKDGQIISGLYAAGEITGGIHGANRLGGNAIVDTVVFGKTAGTSAAKGE